MTKLWIPIGILIVWMLIINIIIVGKSSNNNEQDLSNLREHVTEQFEYQEKINDKMTNLFKIQNKINRRLAGANDDN